jgi:hypothetical protein
LEFSKIKEFIDFSKYIIDKIEWMKRLI